MTQISITNGKYGRAHFYEMALFKKAAELRSSKWGVDVWIDWRRYCSFYRAANRMQLIVYYAGL